MITEAEIFEKIPELAVVEKRQNPILRGIKTYVLRGQRLKDYQIKALEEHFYEYSVVYDGKKIDFEKLFGNKNPVVIEIGFGMGTSTASIAKTNPNINYLGIEVFLYGFSKLLANAVNLGLKNLKIMRFDAVQVLEDMVPDNSVSGFHIFFPDPWQKERHHKRRLIQVPFVNLLTAKLKEDGYIYCVTDWEDYANQMIDVFSQVENLKNEYDGFSPPIEWRPETSFEKKGLDKNHLIREIFVEKKDGK